MTEAIHRIDSHPAVHLQLAKELSGAPELFVSLTYPPTAPKMLRAEIDKLWNEELIPRLDRAFLTLSVVLKTLKDFHESADATAGRTHDNVERRRRYRKDFYRWFQQKLQLPSDILAEVKTIRELEEQQPQLIRKLFPQQVTKLSEEDIDNLMKALHKKPCPGSSELLPWYEKSRVTQDIEVQAAITRSKAIGKPPTEKKPTVRFPSSPAMMDIEAQKDKKGAPRPISNRCFRCKLPGHTARECVVHVAEIIGCSKCSSKSHQGSSCQTKDTHCGRFGCTGNHYPSVCPVNFLPGELTTTARYKDGTPAFDVRKFKVTLVNAYNAYRAHHEDLAVNEIHAEYMVSAMETTMATNEAPSGRDEAEVYLRQQGFDEVLTSHKAENTKHIQTMSVHLHDEVDQVNVVVASEIASGSDTEIVQNELKGKCAYTRLSFYSKTSLTQFTENALLDSGANVNVISLQFFKKAYGKNLFHGRDYVKLNPPVSVGVANGHPVFCHGYVNLHFKIGKQRFRAPFMVFPQCSQEVILGEPGIRTCYGFDFSRPDLSGRMAVCAIEFNNSVQVTSALRDAPICVPLLADMSDIPATKYFAWLVPTMVDGQRRLQFRCPLYEEAQTEPMRDGSRRQSERNKFIASVIFEDMVRKGKVKEITLEQATYTFPYLLVDKLQNTDNYVKLQWPVTPEELIKRFRVTADLRGLNAAQLVVGKDGLVYLIPKRLAGQMPPDNHTPYQYQPSVIEMLSSLPAECAVSYGKIDLSDAFSGVLLSEAMQRLFCTEVATPEGGRKFYSWLVLPQGWRLSPCVFRMVVHFITAEVDRMVTAHFGKKVATIFYLQDDTLVAGNSPEAVTFTMNTLTEVFESYGFKVNKDKCTPATSKINFCGYVLDGPTMTPTATRKQFSMEIAGAIIDHLRNASVARLSVLRTLAGKLNFLYTHFRPEIRGHLRTLQEAINSLQQDKHAKLDSELVSASVHALVDYACHRVPGLCLMNFQATHATLIVVDANQTAWSAVCFAIVTPPEDPNKDRYPNSTTFVDTVKDIKNFPIHLIPEDAVAVPVRLIGGRFGKTMQQKSSTHRERGAMVLSVNELEGDLAGTVIVACDNQNCTKTWHDIDTMFTGEMAAKYENFVRLTDHVVWTPRDSLPALADAVARLLDDYEVGQRDREAPFDNDQCFTIAADTASQSPLQTFLLEVAGNYTTDDRSTYNGIPMANICATLLNPDAEIMDEKAVRMARRRFEISNGLVYYLSDGYKRLYIPKFTTSSIFPDVTAASRSCLLRLCHEGNGPHVGEVATVTDLLLDYWWPGIYDDVARYVGSCITCVMEKACKPPPTGVLSSTTLPASRPFGFVMVDFAELKSPRQTVLLIVCCYSRYCVVVPTPDETAATMGRALYTHLFLVHGVPEHIHSDRGTAFTAEATRVLMAQTGISHTFTMNRFPRPQGFVERHVLEVKRLMGTLHRRNITNVTESLAQVTAVMNFRKQGNHGFSPYEIAFGRAPNTIKSLIQTQETRQVTRSDRSWIQESKTLLHALADHARISRLQRTEDAYTLAAHPTKINRGDLVLLTMAQPVPGKTDHLVTGPYVVLRKVSHNIYEISEEVWEPGRPIEENMRTQRRSEMQLRLLDDPSDTRHGLPRDPRLPPVGTTVTQSRPKGRPPRPQEALIPRTTS